MNYIQTLQDTFRVLRTTKLVWVFGFLSLIITIIRPMSQFMRGEPLFVFIYLPVSLAIFYFSFIANGGFIYTIYQNILGQNPTFSDIWLHSKTKTFNIIVSSFPSILLTFLVYMVTKYALPNSQFLWFINLSSTSFIGSLYFFGVCAIMINDVKVVSAIRTGFLIALNNFFRVLIIAGIAYLIRILLTGSVIAILLVFGYPSNQKIMNIPIVTTSVWIFYLILIVPTSALLTLGYLKFTKGVSYPTLSNEQNAA